MVESELFIPEDNDRMREEFEGFGKGCCGPAALAVLFRTSITEVLLLYKSILKKEYPGHLSLKDLRAFLSHYGYDTKLKNGGKAKTFPKPEKGSIVIARIQWTRKDRGRFHGYKSWQEASCNTHLVLIQESEGETFVFCNGEGWFNAEDPDYAFYLEPGYVTSYLLVYGPGADRAANPYRDGAPAVRQ